MLTGRGCFLITKKAYDIDSCKLTKYQYLKRRVINGLDPLPFIRKPICLGLLFGSQ